MFVVGVAREVGVGRVLGLIAFFLVFGLGFVVLGFVVLSPLVLYLCAFFFIFRFEVRLIEQLCDGRLDATKRRWVSTIVNRTLI